MDRELKRSRVCDTFLEGTVTYCLDGHLDEHLFVTTDCSVIFASFNV